MRAFSITVFRMIRAIGAFGVLIFSSYTAQSQQVSADARTDTSQIRIGQQFHLILEATHTPREKVVFPQVPDTFALMEVVQRSGIDTVNVSKALITRRQTFKLTSFDSGFHVIQPFFFTIPQNADTISTRPLLISVIGLDVDTTRAIKDLKGQIAVPYTWRDFLPWILGLAGLIALYLMIRKYLRKRKTNTIIEKPEPARPAHEIALEALQELESKKLWQNGNHKAYHSGLSDIIRNFIEMRWHIHAMEMTTDEILSVRIISNLDQKTFDDLRSILELADQVKFAKLIPVVTDNEQSIRMAYEFVNQCKEIVTGKEVTP